MVQAIKLNYLLQPNSILFSVFFIDADHVKRAPKPYPTALLGQY
jgi:hypothetical protein